MRAGSSAHWHVLPILGRLAASVSTRTGHGGALRGLHRKAERGYQQRLQIPGHQYAWHFPSLHCNGYNKYYSVTEMLIQLGLPSFNTVVCNAQFTCNSRLKSSVNSSVQTALLV